MVGVNCFFVFEGDFWNLSKMILILLVGETYLNHLFRQIFLGRRFFSWLVFSGHMHTLVVGHRRSTTFDNLP